MNKIKENIPRCRELAIPQEIFGRNMDVDPFKVKRRALSDRMTDSLNRLARPRNVTFEEESIDYVIPRKSKILPIESSERHAKLRVALLNRGRIANSLITSRQNQLDLDTYAQRVKRGSLSYRIPDSPKNFRQSSKTSYQDEPFTDYPRSRASKRRDIFGSGNCEKTLTNRVKNRLTLDAYAEMVAKNDKQCPDRIKRLAIPRRPNTFEDDWSIDSNLSIGADWSFSDNLI